MTSEVWNGLKLLTNCWNTKYMAWLAVTPAKLRKLMLQTHLQIGSNYFILTWPVTSQMAWRSTKFVFHGLIFQGYRLLFSRFRSVVQFRSYGGGGGSKLPPSGWWVARRPSGCRVNLRPSLGPSESSSGQDTLGPSIQRSQPLLHTSIALNGRRQFAAPRPEAAVA